MSPRLTEIWVYLAASPLLWLTLTLIAYQAAVAVYQRAGQHPLATPMPLAVAVLAVVLWLSGTPYEHYFEGAKFVHFLLGPATVALAIPLYGEWSRLKRMVGPLMIALIIGSSTAVALAVSLASWLGASHATVMSMVPKSVTTPIAMAIAEKIGGLPTLAAVMVLMTGVIGAVCGPLVLRVFKITDPTAQGFAMGLAAHGIGTARAFQSHPTAGAFSALAMGMNALFTATAVPLLVQVWA
ncbi:MAG: hypothetical protein RIR70_2123 [Pseudomonadota bacterium]|jgi:predicted murein hydrolase (TIGR00659 family)